MSRSCCCGSPPYPTLILCSGIVCSEQRITTQHKHTDTRNPISLSISFAHPKNPPLDRDANMCLASHISIIRNVSVCVYQCVLCVPMCVPKVEFINKLQDNITQYIQKCSESQFIVHSSPSQSLQLISDGAIGRRSLSYALLSALYCDG